MEQIIVDENGESIWIDPRIKLKAVKDELAERLEDIKMRIDKNEKSLYPRKLEFNSQISQRLTLVFSKFPVIQTKYANNIDVNTLRDYILVYFELVEFIMNYYEEFISTKPLFCMFVGIEPFAYNNWLVCENSEIVAQVKFIETHFEEINFISAQTGKLKEKSTETRLRADELGHSMNLKNEEDKRQTINVISFDSKTISKQIADLGIKLLDNKDK